MYTFTTTTKNHQLRLLYSHPPGSEDLEAKEKVGWERGERDSLESSHWFISGPDLQLHKVRSDDFITCRACSYGLALFVPLYPFSILISRDERRKQDRTSGIRLTINRIDIRP
jgi:hypothetical protein